jgi:hypothetical protein
MAVLLLHLSDSVYVFMWVSLAYYWGSLLAGLLLLIKAFKEERLSYAYWVIALCAPVVLVIVSIPYFDRVSSDSNPFLHFLWPQYFLAAVAVKAWTKLRKVKKPPTEV